MSTGQTPEPKSPTTLVVGLGNPILGDDGVGWRVAQEVERRVDIPGVDVECVALGGLSLMERMIGYDRAVLIDAVVTGRNSVGSVVLLRIEDLCSGVTGHSGSAHDVSLATALEIGRTLGAGLPSDILIVGIEAEPNFDFGTELTEAVAEAVPRAVEVVMESVALAS